MTGAWAWSSFTPAPMTAMPECRSASSVSITPLRPQSSRWLFARVRMLNPARRSERGPRGTGSRGGQPRPGPCAPFTFREAPDAGRAVDRDNRLRTVPRTRRGGLRVSRLASDAAAREAFEDPLTEPGRVEPFRGAEQRLQRRRETGPRAAGRLHSRRALGAELAAEQEQRLENQLVARPRAELSIRFHERAQLPERSGQDGPVGMRISLLAAIVVGHRDRRGQAAPVELSRIVAPMPGPDVRGREHRRGPVVAEAFVELGLGVA